MKSQKADGLSRRDFVKTTGAASAAIMASGNFAYASGVEEIKVGVIGCGGRGTGAITQNLEASPVTKIVAMGDLFEDRLKKSHEDVTKFAAEKGFSDRFAVAKENMFTGFDAYEKVIASDVDLIIMATPPAFRPMHLKASIMAGKHVFMEKPVAVDSVGIRSVIESSNLAEQKGLAIVSGTQRRHQAEYLDHMKMIQDGAIGEVISGQVYWNQGALWQKPRQDSWSDMEWQLRNWLYFTWASGDHIVEQHIHNIDVANWAVGETPESAVGLGGRQVRVDPGYGHIFDHFAVEFTYPSGAKIQSFCRQIDGTASNVSEHIMGTKGTSNPQKWVKSGPWLYEFEGKKVNPYVQEHTDLVESIQSGKLLNEGKRVAESCLSAIMGREACYTGKVIKWDEILNSPLDLTPPSLDFVSMKVPAIPVPGSTTLERNEWA